MARPKRQEAHEELFNINSPAFSALIDMHLKALDWQRPDFKKAIQDKLGDYVSAAQLSRWGYGQRSVSRGLAIRAAVALTLEYESQRRSGKQLDALMCLDQLDVIIQEFLNKAGYPGNLKILPPSDVLWERIHAEKLSIAIGFNSCPPWAAAGAIEPTGVAIDIAKRAMVLLGFRHHFEELSWAEMPEAIRERRVHLIAPLLMKVPARLYDFRFSKAVTQRYSLGVGFIAAMAFCEPNTKTIDEFKKGFALGYIAGEVGEAARAMLRFTSETRLSDIESGANWVFEGVASAEPRVLAYEKASCEKLVGEKQWRQQLRELAPPPSWAKVKFHVCFGAHPDEPQLINAINECLPLLHTFIESEFTQYHLTLDPISK